MQLGRSLNAIKTGPDTDAYSPEKARAELAAARTTIAKLPALNCTG